MTAQVRTGDYYAGGMAVESVANTYVAPTTFMPYVKLNSNDGIKDQPLDTHIGRRGANYYITRQSAEPKVDLQMPAWPENGLEQCLYAALGTKAAGAQQGSTTAYVHAITEASSLPTMSFTKWAGIASQPDVLAYTGGVLDQLKFDWNGPGPMNMDASFITNQVDLSKSTPTATYAASPTFLWPDLRATFDGSNVANMTKLNLTIKNNVQAEHVADGMLSPTLKVPGKLEVTGHVEFAYQDWTELKRYLTGASSPTSSDSIPTTTILDRAMVITCTSGTAAGTGYPYILSFSMPKVNMVAVTIDDSAKNTVKYGFDFRARYSSSDSKTISASVTSKLTAIT